MHIMSKTYNRHQRRLLRQRPFSVACVNGSVDPTANQSALNGIRPARQRRCLGEHRHQYYLLFEICYGAAIDFVVALFEPGFACTRSVEALYYDFARTLFLCTYL